MDNDFNKKFGNRLREIRKANKLSQQELAREIGMTFNTISSIERGKISPKLDTIVKLALALDISLEDFLSFPETFAPNKYTRKMVEQLSRQLLGYDEDFLLLVSRTVENMIKAKNLYQKRG
jgi:putative transcriptional regulator